MYMKIKLLNSFAGIGGNTKNLDRDLFEITHVETNKKRINYLQKTFQDDITIEADAYQYILENIMEYDIVWASPPCPTHSNVRWANRTKENFTYVYPDMQMYGLIFLLQRARQYEPWIVENVTPYYEPLIEPTVKLGRHMIWSNKHIPFKKFGADNIAEIKRDHERNLSVKDLRDEMNGDIGKYIIENLLDKKISLEEFM